MVILYNKLLELFKVGMQMNDKIKENLLDQSCAPTDNLQSNWDRIDWTKAEQAVKKLQARIVKAQKEGRHERGFGTSIVRLHIHVRYRRKCTKKVCCYSSFGHTVGAT
jgi:hypothetical protein